MSKGATGQVKADGLSVVPGDLYDMVELGQDLVLDPKIEEQLQELYEREETGANQKLKATYKLELVVNSQGRSMHKPFAGFLMAWTNGGFAHGGGDEVVYFCAQKTEKNGEEKTCGAPLDLKWVSKKVVVCPKCRQACEPEELCGQIFARLPMQHWASLVLKCFEALNFDADIRMKTMKGDLRVATAKEQERFRGGDLLREVRSQQEWVIYPLQNIMKDTAAGADLYTRIRSFLAA